MGRTQQGVRWRRLQQLVFDVTDSQGRIQLKSSHAASELNLGHLIHAADNYRGSLRGTGAELRTDGYGAVRAGAGLLISSYKITHGADAREPAGDNVGGMALLKQAVTLGETFSGAARTHETVAYASHLGAAKANSSMLDDKAAPLKAMLTATSGMLSQDSIDAAKAEAPKKPVAPGDDKLPHSSDAIIAIAAKAGLGVLAGQNLQLANGETITLMSGQDTQFATGGQMRVHSGQAIGMLGGAVKAGENNLGLQLIAAKDSIDVQAQADVLNVQARDEVNIVSANAHIDWAAAKSISLSTAGGANITIAGGNITIQCPGKITIHAGKKSFGGGARNSYKLPVLPVFLIAPATGRKLQSTFAFDQITLVAKNFTKAEFVMLVAPIFGYDVPATTYIKLYQALRAGSIANPEVQVMAGTHCPASFDNKSRRILVHQAAADRAATDMGESWELLMALMHEFGHYIDLVIRTDLADKNPDGSSTLVADAPDDEGAKFAYGIAFFEFGQTSSTTYAHYTSPKFTGPLKVNYGEARRAIRAAEDEEAQKIEGKSGDIEQFGAGLGEHHHDRPTESFGHQSIEASLAGTLPIFDAEDVLRQIYFGNWLRDFSQVLDPAIVRKPGVPKDFPRAISREKLTQLVDLFAELEFVKKPEDKKLFHVTESLLGVYRPVEHIDNPTNNAPDAPDPQSIDKDFQPRATKEYVSVDPATSMKRYIGFSAKFMRDELGKAVSAGAGKDGFRHFGAALHVLEDYFAHSNFLELSLRKLGHDKVLPWTSPAAGKHPLPVVTGMFDFDDVIASTAGLIADTLFKVEWEFKSIKPGERTKVDRIMLILLSEHSDPKMLKSYEDFLAVRDTIAKIPGREYWQRAMHYTLVMVGNAYNFVYSSLIHLVGNSVDDQQVVRIGDPNKNGSTDPTHSQLAKDHDNHPFHTLAARLAKVAVSKVGRAMGARWEGDLTADPAAIAASFIVHPFDTNWQDEIVKQWAVTHPGQVRRGESATEWEALEKAHKQEAIDAINKTSKQSKDIWKYINDNYESIFEVKNQVRK